MSSFEKIAEKKHTTSPFFGGKTRNSYVLQLQLTRFVNSKHILQPVYVFQL